MATYNFNPIKKGDTFSGIRFTVNINDVPADLTDASIRMQLRTQPLHPTAHEMSTEGGQIEISNAEAGEFEIIEQIIDFPAYNYYYDIEITFANGVVKTYIEGKLPISQDITR